MIRDSSVAAGLSPIFTGGPGGAGGGARVVGSGVLWGTAMVEANPARLTAVLALNIADFEIYEQSDRNAVRRMLPAYLDIIRNQVTENRGRLFQAQKDSFMAEFASPVSAGRTAMGVMAEIAEYNDEQPQHLRMQFRMGVHVGLASGSGRNLGGEAVNVAASLRDIAEPGTICFSQLAYEQSAGRVELMFEELGERDLHGSSKALNVFKGTDGLDMYANASGGGGMGGAFSTRNIVLAAAGLIVATVGLLVAWQQIDKPAATFQPSRGAIAVLDKPAEVPFGRLASDPNAQSATTRQQSENAAGEAGKADANIVSVPVPLPPEPSIAVLPLLNMTREPDQAFLALGLGEEIASALGMTGKLFVAAPHSSFAFEGVSNNVTKAGVQLGVRYALLGTVSRANDRYRFALQLFDGANETPVWAKVIEREGRDLSSLKRDVALELATVLRTPFAPEEGLRLRRRETANAAAYELYLRGLDGLRVGRLESVQSALRAFSRAAELDARFAPALEGLAQAHFQNAQLGNDPAGSIASAQRAAEQALAVDDSLAAARSVLARTLAAQKQFDRALAEAERAIQLAPNYADGHAHLATILTWAGAPEAAVPRMQRAMRLDPVPPAWYLFGMGHAQFLLQKYDNAIAAFRRSLQLNPDWTPSRVYLAAAYAQGGRREMAQFELQRAEVRGAVPAFTSGEQAPYRNPEGLALLQDALRKANAVR